MLSRIAESLFWIGRYVERADGTARILDVHLQLLLEDPWADEDVACRSLLSVIMGCDRRRGRGRVRRRRRAARRSTVDNPSSIAGAWPPPARTPAAPARPSPPSCGRRINTTWHRWRGFGAASAAERARF